MRHRYNRYKRHSHIMLTAEDFIVLMYAMPVGIALVLLAVGYIFGW